MKETSEQVITRLWSQFESIKEILVISGIHISRFPEREKLDTFKDKEVREFDLWFKNFMNREIQAWRKIRKELPEKTWNDYENLGFDETFIEVKLMKKAKRDVFHGWLDYPGNLFRKRKEKKGAKPRKPDIHARKGD